MVIGFIGNGIVVAVITTLRRRGQKSSVQLFLLHLAISDLMVCLLCIPLTIFTNFHYPTEYHARDTGLCKLSRFMQVLSLCSHNLGSHATIAERQRCVTTLPPTAVKRLGQFFVLFHEISFTIKYKHEQGYML